MFTEVKPLEANLLWFYVVVMISGFILFLIAYRRYPKTQKIEILIASAIVLWSGTMYALMAVGEGQILVGDHVLFFARYLDWVVTTPLLLVALAFTAMHYKKKQITLVLTLVLLDILMIVCGFVADFSSDGTKYSWYGLGCFCLVIIFYLTWRPLRQHAAEHSSKLKAIYTILAGYLSALWICYPLAWLFGPSGFNQLEQSTDVALFVFLPILSKVGFSLLDIYLLHRLYEETHEVPCAVD